MTQFRLNQLTLRNFRSFDECRLELHPKLTVIVAENGQGKTAFLDGIAIALGLFVDTVAGSHETKGFARTDIRMLHVNGEVQKAPWTEFIAEGYVGTGEIRWSRSINGQKPKARTSKKNSRALLRTAEEIRQNIIDQPPDSLGERQLLPLVAFYGTGRLWRSHYVKRSKFLTLGSVMSGYRGCLSSGSSFNGVLEWYEQTMNEIRDPRYAASLQRNLSLIAAVREATQVVLKPTLWGDLDWDYEERALYVSHPIHGRLPLSTLSDGIRSTIALVAEVAQRCASLNPQLGELAARGTPGILLIDEVDMHLHPRWQQQIVALLRTAFPKLQMILTSHSPQVLSTVDKESIRIIRNHNGQCNIETPLMQTQGVESADILATIMKVDPVPQIEEALWISQYRALIEDGLMETAEANALRARVVEHFGASHPLILECNRLIRFQAFKLRQPPQERSI